MNGLLKKMFMLLCLLLICITGGCTSKANNSTTVNENVIPISVIEPADSETQLYSTESVPLPKNITGVKIAQEKNSVIYLYGISGQEDDQYEKDQAIYSMDLEGNLLWTYNLALDEAEEEYFSAIQDFYPDEDGLWIMLVVYEDDAIEDYPYYETTLLHIAEERGEVTPDKKLTISSLSSAPLDMIVDDAKECFYLFTVEGLEVIDFSGNEVFGLPCSNYYYHPCFTAEGKLAVCEPQDSSIIIKILDFEKQNWSSEYEIREDYGKMYRGSKYDLYYTDSEHKMLYGLNLQTGESTPILRWLDLGIGIFMMDAFVLDDGIVLAVERSGITIIKPVDAEESTETKTLTLATFDYLDTASMVLQFNKSQSEYQIEVKDYSEYNIGDDDTQGLNQLNLDIVSGDAPDIYDLRSIPISQFVRLGLLEDMNPYIDADPDIDREDYVPSLLSAMEIDGGLYCIMPHVGVISLAADPELMAGRTSLSFAEMIELYGGSDPFGDNLTRYDFIQYMLAGSQSPFVDWENGNCSFDSQDFIRVLEFARLLPESYSDSGGIYTGEKNPSLAIASVSSVGDVIFTSAALGCTNSQEECATFVGLPGDGEGNYLLYPISGSWGISSTSKNKDGAWTFIRKYLLTDYQETNATSLLGGIWEVTQEEYYSRLDEGGFSFFIVTDEGEMDLNITNGVYYEAMVAVLEKANGIYEENPALMEIIWDEAQGYFAGDKTAEQAAQSIQSRVSIYIAEQS